jgi:hypothetical protein
MGGGETLGSCEGWMMLVAHVECGKTWPRGSATTLTGLQPGEVCGEPTLCNESET